MPWPFSLQAGKEFAECGLVGETEPVGNLGDAQVGRSQQESGLHDQELIHIVDDSASCYLPHDTGQVAGRDIQRVGIEGNVMMLHEMLRQQAHEADEYFLCSSWNKFRLH